MRSLLLRGMLAGAGAALLAFAFAKVFGEPQVDRAIGFEEHLAAVTGRPAEPELVSRGVQSTAGLLIAVVAYGVALGGIFALTFAYAYGRLGLPGARAVALALAGGGFVAVTLVPFLKYPASPPSVGNPDTIGHRTLLFFVMIAISICGAIAAVRVARAARARLGAWEGAIAGGAVFVGLVALAALVLPGVDEVPKDFPAGALWRFRLSTLGIHTILWSVTGLAFGALAERVLGAPRPRGVRAPDVVA
ncbi:MAG TPA: CbtA family protein [Baekduia sp.]|nr:CbtA family protein [Baekduia sp.]HMJ32755.1 CbtA family protein [Baekduia sp.]